MTELLVEDIRLRLASLCRTDDWDGDAGVEDAAFEAHAIVERAQAVALEHGGSVQDIAQGYAERRASGELLGSVLGRVRFCGLEIVVGPGCLVPRRDTKLLAGAAIALFEGLDVVNPVVIDMCCGAGNLACAMALACPRARVYASDLTDPCVSTAKANVQRLGLSDRVEVLQGDLFGSLLGRDLEGRADLVVCNPPYISTKRLESARSTLLAREPREAFDGGPYGLSIHQRAIRDAAAFLRDGGWLGLELGKGQQRQIALLFERAKEAYTEPTWKTDESGVARVALAQKRENARA
jgi:HemK-like putative methylase